MPKLIDCPKCKVKNSVKIRRAIAGNVVGFSCGQCGSVFSAEASWHEPTNEVVYWGLEHNPDFAAKTPEFWQSLSEILELEKRGVKQFLGKYRMFAEQPKADD